MPKATKEKGIQAYLEYNNIPITDASVIGDSQNDIGMMKLVKKSFYCVNIRLLNMDIYTGVLFHYQKNGRHNNPFHHIYTCFHYV